MPMIVSSRSRPAPPVAAPRPRRAALTVAVCALGLAGPVRAAEPAPEPDPGSLGAGSILVRGRVVGSIPVNQHSRVEPIGGRVVTPARALPDLDATYFLTDHFALAGQAGIVSTRTSIRGSYIGNLPIGDTWSASLTAAIQFHIPLEGGFKPYLGAGIGYTVPLAYEPAKPFVTAMKADPQLGPMLQAGLDYHLGGRWYANLEFKQIFLPPLVSRIGPGSATVKLDMMIVGAGLGYRF
ncbi:OmpW/AlkL family protein [Methylobacterium gregans]|uniref:OmpW family protein n=2 Tax=Methylobacterium gregans TaxID=374424 RepID=A0AA37MGK2_9HYPH|nr:hypothetical protein NBEOAGPD_4857 [Methylobacterium gregans]GLS54338.1 outer membrane protein [Methylobacterium gregans]